MKFRTKISLILSVVGIVALMTSVYFMKYSVRDSFKKEILSQQRIVVETIEGTYFSFVRSMRLRAVERSSDARIRALAEVISDQNVSLLVRKQAVDDFATYIKAQKIPYDKELLIVDLLDNNGYIVASTHDERIGLHEGVEEKEELGGEHYFSKAINSTEQGEAFVRGVVFEKDETDQPLTHAVVRLFSLEKDVHGQAKPLPVVILTHELVGEKLPQILSGDLQLKEGALTGDIFIKTYHSANVYLVDKDHRILASASPMAPGESAEPIIKQAANNCINNNLETSEEVVDKQGKRVILSSMCLSRDGLTLIVKVDSDEAFVVYTSLLQKTYVGGTILFVVFASVLALLLRRPLQSLSHTASVAKQVSNGDFSLRTIVSGKDEFADLAKAFNTMLDTVELTQGDLKKSNNEIAQKSLILEKDIEEHRKQEKFLEESKKATLNLLEDSWKAKEGFEEERNKLQTILASIEDGIILIDTGYKILLVNTKVFEIFGMSTGELLGKDLREVIKLYKNKTYVDTEKWPIEEMFLTKKAIVATIGDNFTLTTNGRPTQLPVAFSVAPMGGRFSGAVIVVRDVTEDRELDEAKSGFISVASHQLRTPLTSIRWYSEMLLSEDAGSLNDSQKDFMKEIHGGAERLYQTVDLLLGISRVESGKMKVDRTPLDLGVFTESIVKEISSQMKEKELVLSVVPPQRDPVVVWLDPITLRQVVLNLFSNAIRYTNKGGFIEVKWWLGDDGKEVVYMVHDNGIGIPESQRSRIFSKFFRAENARAQVPDGSGLGLALVKDLVGSWGGKVWFDSGEGQGTTFFFTVPLVTKVA